MANPETARWLRQKLNEDRDFVMKYDRQWVAVRYNEVIAARHNVRELITLVSEISGMDDPIKEKPVISFVTAGILQ